VSFVFGRDIYRLQSIERYTRQVIRRERIPSVEQVEGRRADLIFDGLKERLESGKFDPIRTTSTACWNKATPPPTSPARWSPCCAKPAAARGP
jgi:hypothetical protein